MDLIKVNVKSGRCAKPRERDSIVKQDEAADCETALLLLLRLEIMSRPIESSNSSSSPAIAPLPLLLPNGNFLISFGPVGVHPVSCSFDRCAARHGAVYFT